MPWLFNFVTLFLSFFNQFRYIISFRIFVSFCISVFSLRFVSQFNIRFSFHFSYTSLVDDISDGEGECSTTR